MVAAAEVAEDTKIIEEVVVEASAAEEVAMAEVWTT